MSWDESRQRLTEQVRADLAAVQQWRRRVVLTEETSTLVTAPRTSAIHRGPRRLVGVA